MGFSKLIRRQDLFGRKVEFGFNNEGSSHNTYIGGGFSVIVRSFIIVFISSLIFKLATHGDDTISTIFS